MRLFVLIIFMLAGCSSVSSGNYERGLQKWVGQPEQELFQAWGMPGNVF